MMAMAIGGLAWAMLELLYNRAGRTAGTFALQGRMGDMVVVIQHLFEITDNLPLAQAVVWFDIDMRRKGRDV